MSMYASDKDPINLHTGSELTAYFEGLDNSFFYGATISAGPSDVNPPEHELYFILPLDETDTSFLENQFNSEFDFLTTYWEIKDNEEKRLTRNPEELKTSKVSEIYETAIDTIEREFREHKVKAKFYDSLFYICGRIRPKIAESLTVRNCLNREYFPVLIEEILRLDKVMHPGDDVRDFILANKPPYHISAYDVELKPDQIVPLKI